MMGFHGSGWASYGTQLSDGVFWRNSLERFLQQADVHKSTNIWVGKYVRYLYEEQI